MSRPRTTRRPGFALLIALWLLVALGALGLEIALVSRRHRLAAANTIEHTRAQAAAEAGLAEARARLARLATGTGLPGGAANAEQMLDPWAGATAFVGDTLTLGDEHALVRLRDAGAAVNINLASETELRRLLTALDVDFGEADRIAQCIADWRDADDAHRARGAERDLYLRLGRPVLPTNRPFTSLAELQSVYGMTAKVYALLLPYLTLRGTGRININSATREVLLTLPGMSERAAAVILAARSARGPIHDLNDVARALPSGERERFTDSLPVLLARTSLDTRELELTSTGWAAASPVRARVEALLVLAGGAIAGVTGSATYLVWKRSE